MVESDTLFCIYIAIWNPVYQHLSDVSDVQWHIYFIKTTILRRMEEADVLWIQERFSQTWFLVAEQVLFLVM